MPLVEFYVTVQKGDHLFFNQYCRKTGVQVQKLPNHQLKAGPFISGYEATWLSGMTPYSQVLEVDKFKPYAAKIALNDLKQAQTEWIRIKDAPNVKATKMEFDSYAIIRFRSDWGAEYFLKTKTLLKSIGFRSSTDFYQESFGLGIIDMDHHPYFLSVENGARGTGEKSEIFRLWTFNSEKRLVLHDFKTVGFIGLCPDDLDVCVDNYAVDRIALVDRTLKVKHLNMAIHELPAARNISTKLNYWCNWQEQSNLPELVELKTDAPFKEAYDVYLFDPEIIANKAKEMEAQMSVFPGSIQNILYQISEQPWGDQTVLSSLTKNISSEDLVMAIKNYSVFNCDHPVHIIPEYLKEIILYFGKAPEIRKNVKVKQALIAEIKNMNDFNAYIDYMPLLCFFSGIENVKIAFPEMNVSLYFQNNSFRREGADFDWRQQGEMIKEKTFQWWQDNWY